jgi:hypothetical protein
MANQQVFGDTKGVYFWVAGRGKTEGDFRRLIQTELANQGLSLDEVAEVMLAEKGLKEEHPTVNEWKHLIAGAKASPSLVMGSNFYFYEERD